MIEQFLAGFQHYLTGAPVLAFAAAFVAGVLVSLTPCVYPMIPITVALIGGGSAGKSKLRSFVLSFVYVVGIAVTYAVLGVVSALAHKVFGFTSGNPIVMLTVGFFFIVFGMAMLDIVKIPLPGFMTNFQPKQRSGLAGAFLIGLLSGFVAVPCSTPVLLAILTHIAQKGGVVYGFTLMFSYALGFGVLIMVIGVWAGSVASLPKSGQWMVWIKRFCGVVLIVVGAWFAWSGHAAHRRTEIANQKQMHGSETASRAPGLGRMYALDDPAFITDKIGRKPVFLVFFGTYCTKCIAEIPELKKLHAEFKDKGLEFYAVDIDDSEASARVFIEKHEINYPVVLDRTRSVFADKFGVMSTPTLIVYSRDGKELYNGSDDPAKVRRYILEALEK